MRYTLLILAIAGSAATAWASMAPVPAVSRNVTVIEKNQFWPLEGKLVVEKCGVEDCSDTPQG